MKHKLSTLGLCALVALLAILALSKKGPSSGTSATTQTLVVTQNGKMTVLPRPDGYSTMVVIANTNSLSSSTNSPKK